MQTSAFQIPSCQLTATKIWLAESIWWAGWKSTEGRFSRSEKTQQLTCYGKMTKSKHYRKHV